MNGWITWFLRAASHYTTLWIGAHFGKHFPMHFVCGYPRSGTTWFSELLADYLNLPRPRHSIFPIGFASVIHTHSESKSPLDDCFLVMRDGRDVMVSLYFYLLAQKDDPAFTGRNTFANLFGSPMDPNDLNRNLPIFLEYIFTHPIGTRTNWAEHSLGWKRKAQGSGSRIVTVHFEDLVRDSMGTFTMALAMKYGEFDIETAQEAVSRQQFQRQKRRKADQQRTLLRGGKSGDWRQAFCSGSRQVFDHYAGEALIELGYESDHNWVLDK
jgi:hypothetical protein